MAATLLTASLLHGQTVTLDFTLPGSFPPVPAPWIEDGFTVSQSSPVVLGPGVFIVRDESLPPSTNSDKTTGYLDVGAISPSLQLIAIITNNAAQPFDLLSLDFYALIRAPGFTGEARLISSAGGSLDMNGALPNSTLTFTGDAWRNLSFLKLDVRAGANDLEGQELHLDNFVLRVNSVPEPSHWALMTAGLLVLAVARRQSLMGTYRSWSPAVSPTRTALTIADNNFAQPCIWVRGVGIGKAHFSQKNGVLVSFCELP